jgi:RNA polymerase sigma factor (sigma-70 family)
MMTSSDCATTRSGAPISHERLDRRLEILARDPRQFARGARLLSASLDARKCDLEISDPSLWRGVASSARTSVDNLFSAAIDGVKIMDREEELRLARRIEFAKIRLDRTLKRHGLVEEDLARRTDLPDAVSRRKLEWHSLRMEMVERNLYLVPINVERYRHTTADRSDLMQAAAAGLFRAVDGFDWRRGVLFRTYAVHWLNEGFRTHLYNFNNTVRVPVYLQKALKHVNAAVQRLGDPHASVEQIARETGLRENLIVSARTAVRRMRSLDAPIGDSNGTHSLSSELALKDDEGPYHIALEDVSIEAGVAAVLGTLSERDRRVVKMRFGIGYGRRHVYSEIAKELGVSLERVRQILLRAMTKMGTPLLRKRYDFLVT